MMIGKRLFYSSMLFGTFASPGCGGLDDHTSTSGADAREAAQRNEQVSRADESEPPVQLDDTNLIARTTIGDLHRVDFHEVAPGQVQVAEVFPPGAQSVLVEHSLELTTLELWERISPNEPAPEELVAANEREAQRLREIDEQHADTVEDTSREGAGMLLENEALPELEPGRNLQHSTPDDFTAQQRHDHFSGHGYCLQGTPDEYDLNHPNEVCKFTNWANGFWAERFAKSASFIIDHWKGNGVQIKLLYDTGHCRDSLAGVKENEVWTFRMNCAAPGNVGRRIEVANASGDHFHIAGHWWRP